MPKSALWHLSNQCFWSLPGPETDAFVPPFLRLFQVVCSSSLKTLKPLIRTHSGGPSHTLNGRSLTFITSSAAALKGSRGNPIKCVCARVCVCVCVCGMGPPLAGVEVSDLLCLSPQSSQTAQVFPQHSSSHTLISGLLFVSCGYDLAAAAAAGGGGWKYTQLCCLPPIFIAHNFYI